MTFQAKIEPGQSGKKIENVATVDGGNIDTPDKPKAEVTINPKDPELESEKTASNLDTEKESYEVGDTIVYTIKARNTVSDSIIEDFVISDELPAGLSFVDGSLEVSDGGKGSFEEGTITANFENVTDTEWRTVTFQAKIETGQSGKKIENVATVDGGNIDTPDKPKAEVTINPKDSVATAGGDNEEKPDKPSKPSDVKDQVPVKSGETEGKPLPDTATNNFNMLVAGVVQLLIGLATLYLRKRKVN